MTNTTIKAGEVICLASGVYEGYSKKGPFVAMSEFDLLAFIDAARISEMEPWQIDTLMYDLSGLLLDCGLITKMPCRSIHLGAFGELDVREELDG